MISKTRRILLILVASAGCLAALPAHAQQIIQVNNASALQPALDSVLDGGIIELAAGTYSAPSGGWTVFPDLGGGTRSFTVRAAAGATVILSGNGANRIMTLTTPKPIAFERLIFSDGLSVEEYHGGALSLANAQVSFAQCTFQNNVANPASTGGGALWIDTSIVSFQACVWTNNSSKNYAGAFSAFLSRVYVRDSRFSGNRTNLPGHSSFNGGGCIHGNASTIRIANTRFENNQAGYVGGAIYVIGPYGTPDMNLVVTDSLFTGNFVLRDPAGTNTAPTTGGAIFMEDNTKAHFFNCRFLNNSAQQGGAVSSYRTTTELKNCVLLNNTATGGPQNGESLGGHIIVLSDDNADSSTNNGTVNRPSAQLALTDCLIRGQGAAGVSARQGGGIFVAGDLHAAYGIGVPQNGTPASNRTIVNLQRVVFADLASADSAGNGTGGAMTADFVTLNADSCIIENCSASQYGGAFQFIHSSSTTITNTTFSHNAGGVLGGAVMVLGGNFNLSNSNLTDNQLTAPGGGSALMGAADSGGGQIPPNDLTGAVENCVISNNSGGPATIYDGYRNAAPVNRLQYKGNKIFPSDNSAMFIDTIGSQSVSGINNLTVSFADGSSVAKGPVPNIALNSAQPVGAILMVPQMIASTGAPGESLPLPAYVGYASSGGTAVVDGTTMRNASDVIQASSNNAHTLTVGGNTYSTVPPPGFALNISTRLPVGTGQQVLIGGFIILGPNPKTIMLRAIGPSLPFAGVLADPYMELHDGTGALIATNDNWRTTNLGGVLTSNQAIDIIASTIPPSNNRESAIIATLNPGSYTAIVRGATNDTGIAVVEGYDLDADPVSKLANISTRGYIQTGDNVMIGGFIYGGGPGATKVVVRGIGPSLAAFGVSNPLMDPVLELHDGNGSTIDSNDNWITNQAAIAATGLQPSNNAEAAMLETKLPPGAYTAVLRGNDSGVGVGVVEVYVFQ
jgi:Chlamydia polymorphic membrane protein (Chlamydia_PMP) repeat